MEDGLYKSLGTRRLLNEIASLGAPQAAWEDVEDAEQPHVLARHVGQLVEHALRSRHGAERNHLANRLIEAIDAQEIIDDPPRQLRYFRRLANHTSPDAPARPATPLSDAALLTNVRGEPSLGAELRAELASADQVDLLCAFVKWHGLRVIEDNLRELRDRGVPFRVITTTYMGATERRAIDRLVEEFGAEVRIHYDEAKTRLHAKAWLFHRKSEFDTAYVGSSNLSRSALLDGLEWNVRLSNVATPHLIQKFNGTFDTYWNDPTFRPYDPTDLSQRNQLDHALAVAGGKKTAGVQSLNLSGLDVRPYAFQQHILDAIEAERELHGRHRNLVVAATGTGKTVVAALDYRRLSNASTKTYPSLLFVAHRAEILEQSRRTYQEVLSDPNFGELYVAGNRPERWKHVFASVQSLRSTDVRTVPPNAFDIVVIDEFHHAAAASYTALLEHLTPRELLGLTATPERADGFDVRGFFGGRTAAELRLWEALDAGILSPFHYFMCSDGTDLRDVPWVRGRYEPAQLENLYTGNDARSRVILREVHDKVLDVHSMRALGFCVGVEHAKYMARVFSERGINAIALDGSSTVEHRRASLERLSKGDVNIIFSADLFNEGIDIPDVDTILFLRPTSSATIFLQQLGRGLRQRPDKPVLTVLDFVGNQREEFRFDLKLQALTGRPPRRLEKDLKDGFPFLPAGSQVVLDRRAQEVVLRSLKAQINARWPHLVAQLRALDPDIDLPNFIDRTGYTLATILRKGNRSWTELRREAGHLESQGSNLEAVLAKRLRAFTHVDDPIRHEGYQRTLQEITEGGDLSLDDKLAEMLFFSLWPGGGGHASATEGLRTLTKEPEFVDELRTVIDLAYESARRPVAPTPGRLATLPLRIHARYQREEVLVALGYSSLTRKPNSFREGVLYEPNLNVDAFFVTLNKTEERYSPTTMYRDFPISRELFHWESQSTTSINSSTGRRYISGSSTVLLFVRQEGQDEFGTSPYLYLGPATYVGSSHSRV
ncbi:DUF3427 domain-containing protein [Georgenia sp. Z1344]|uniref:DUF3427 domain-containing protein n=1 Tax=Georgenia sp. Z1344 TaxID=3416706 RepID=UPI003CF92075